MRIHLVHWHRGEARERVARLQVAGYDVVHNPATPVALRALREDPPAAVVIDLTRLPMQGRDIGVALRHYRTTRHLPVVFVDGDPAKVSRVKAMLPDAVYTSWRRIRSALRHAIAHPPQDPVAPRSVMAGYAGTPLVKKLGIAAETVVALIGAPDGFEATLGELPAGVTLRRSARGRRDLTIWFVRSRAELDRRIGSMTSAAPRGGLWIVWPKKTSRLASDLSQPVVRAAGLAAGLVDFKVCAVNRTWTGLRFTRRSAAR